MADDAEGEGRLTRASGFLFMHMEHAVYAVLGLLLAGTAVLALLGASGLFAEAVHEFGSSGKLLEIVDRLLFVLMLVEILHTVRVSMRSGKLTCEPFLIVGLIASIRRVLVITLQSSEVTHGPLTPEREALFRISMIELGVLGGLILVMVLSIFLLHRARDDQQVAGQE
jgi:uncharacterized membrane protein (DUF373 family)